MVSDIRTLSTRKEEILAAARRLFSEAGYESASMRDLADAVGVKAASLYSAFESKEEMLWEIALRCANDFHQEVEAVEMQALPPVQKLEGMIRAHIEVMIRNRDAAAIFFRDWKQLSEPRRSQYLAFQEAYEQRFVAVIEEGISTGAIRPLSAEFTGKALLAALQWTPRWYRPGGAFSPSALSQTLSEMLLHGIVTNPDTQNP